MSELTRKGRILYALKQIGIERIDQFNEKHGSAIYAQLYRQLFDPSDKYKVTIDVVSYICTKYPQISYQYVIDGDCSWERTKIVTPPTHRQDIHIAEGATAAISQSGEATVAPADSSTEPAQPTKREVFTPADIARMIKDNDLAGLVAIIFDQQQQLRELSDEYHTEIIRLQNQRNTDLLREMRLVDDKLFPDPH